MSFVGFICTRRSIFSFIIYVCYPSPYAFDEQGHQELNGKSIIVFLLMVGIVAADGLRFLAVFGTV